MTIKFVCSCGKHLRARDEMAGRRLVCPRCGHPVGVPSRPGTDAVPLPSAERDRRAGGQTTASPDPVGAATLALLRGLRGASRRPPRAPEAHWYDFLTYPLHDWRLWAPSAALLSLVSAVVLPLVPRMMANRSDGGVAGWAPWLAGMLVLPVCGFACNFLGHVLRAGAAGDGSAVRWPGYTVGATLAGALVWLACFLAGPVVFAGFAAAYWIECGDPRWLDWLILGELGLFTVGYYLLVLLAVSEGGRLRDANPLHVIDLAHRLGWRAAVAALAGFLLATGHGLLGVYAAGQLHENALIGLPLLAACWVSGLYWAALLFRLLGVWCHRTRGRAPRRSIDRPFSLPGAAPR